MSQYQTLIQSDSLSAYIPVNHESKPQKTELGHESSLNQSSLKALAAKASERISARITFESLVKNSESNRESKGKKIGGSESPIQALARRRLEMLAKEFNHPADDLLDWYKHDLEDLGEYPKEWAREAVTEYLRNLATYRPHLALSRR